MNELTAELVWQGQLTGFATCRGLAQLLGKIRNHGPSSYGNSTSSE